MSHHLSLAKTGRNGCWATCSCGWASEIFTTTTGAHLAFGSHLTTDPRCTDAATTNGAHDEQD